MTTDQWLALRDLCDGAIAGRDIEVRRILALDGSYGTWEKWNSLNVILDFFRNQYRLAPINHPVWVALDVDGQVRCSNSHRAVVQAWIDAQTGHKCQLVEYVRRGT